LVRVSRRVGIPALTPHMVRVGEPPHPLQASQKRPAAPVPRVPEPVGPGTTKSTFPSKSFPKPCSTKRRIAGANPLTPFNEPGRPVHIRRISCSFSSSNEVLFSFPLRYLFAIGYHAFIFSLGWPAPPIFSQHFQASLLAGKLLAAPTYQVACNALCAGTSSRYCRSSPCGTHP